MKTYPRALLPLCLSVLMSGCQYNLDEIFVAALELRPEFGEAQVTVHTPLKLRVVRTLPDGTEADVTDQAEWSSSDLDLLNVGNDETSPGEVTTSSYAGGTSGTVYATVDGVRAELRVMIGCPRSAGGYAGGDGSARSPYLICSKEDLEELAGRPSDWASGHFAQVNRIELDSKPVRIGDATRPFNGVFDGQGHVIRGLWTDEESQDQIGLFGVLGERGELRDVHFRRWDGESVEGAHPTDHLD